MHKKSIKPQLLLPALLFLASCGGQKAETPETVQTEPEQGEVRGLPSYTYTDSLTLGSHKVVCTITCQADEELPLVVDEDGTKYADNRFGLVIKRDAQELFSRSFSKADFHSLLTADFRKYGILDGMRFHHAEDGKLYFNTCVSYPESDMSCPFFLIVGPDGSYSITPDTTPDYE